MYVGMPGSFDSELVFPDMEVEEGERIVVYYGYLPQGETPLEWYGGETRYRSKQWGDFALYITGRQDTRCGDVQQPHQ